MIQAGRRITMKVAAILEQIKKTRGSNAKIDILKSNSKNSQLKKALKYGLDPFINFNVVKVPKVVNREVYGDESTKWCRFFDAADSCASREVTGNAAVDLMHRTFSSVSDADEKWMRKILKKHLAIGASTKTINKVFPGLISTFEVQLAETWHEKHVKKLPGKIRIEPKLDGIRCLAVVRSGECQMFARSGKLITNFDAAIGAQLANLPDGVYDGEIMSNDFTALMRQVHRKKNVDVSSAYLALFDAVTLEEWDSKKGTSPLRDRRRRLEKICNEHSLDGVLLVEQKEIDCETGAISAQQKIWEEQGYEGAMVKNPDAVYKFGRSRGMLKVKSFHDIDLEVIGFKEGTGKHRDKLGSILVDFRGVEVNVGSGFDDEQRSEIWNNRDNYLGMTAECRYQEITPDGSLRFPTFVCWRLDK